MCPTPKWLNYLCLLATAIVLCYMASGCAHYVWVDKQDCPEEIKDKGLAKCREVK